MGIRNRRDGLIAGLALVAGFGFSVGFASPADACGTLRYLSAKYWAPSATDDGRLTTVQELSSVCGDFRAHESEGPIFAILKDALARGIDRRHVQRSFESYWCLAGIRSEPGYAKFVAQLDRPKCPSAATVAQWQVVSVSGANIRMAPDKNSTKIGYALRGMLLEKLETRNDWVRIRRMSKHTGYIHKSLLKKY